MSTAFFLTRYDPTVGVELPDDPRIDSWAYAQKLREKWPTAEITFNEQYEGYVLWFAIPFQSDPIWHLLGGLQRRADCVTFNTPLKEDFCSFVMWHRSIVPASQQVFLWDESNWDVVLEVTATTTGPEIANFAGWGA